MEMNFKTICNVLGILALTMSLALLAGCGGEDPGESLFPTTGMVTLDGQPLTGATVDFIPKSTGENQPLRGSIGVTDEEGKFIMLYRSTRGCPAGDFTVSISNYSEPTGEGGDEETGSPELVPSAYRGPKSKLEATVSSGGENDFNFALKSDGS